MRIRSTQVKIGVLAATVIAAVVAIVIGLGLRRGPTDTYHVYFDESVQGLAIGALVTYRGVDIGRVEAIGVAPDRRHVDVVVAVARGEAQRLALEDSAPRLRARLVIQGVTGLKQIDLDVAGPSAPALAPLTFTPSRRHIRARTSLFEDLGADLEAVGDRLPALLDRSMSTLAKLEEFLTSAEHLVESADRAELPQRAADVLASAERTLADVRHVVAELQRAGVPERMRVALGRVDAVIARVDGVVDEVGDSTVDSSLELQRTLRELGEAARSLHDLIDEIERDPDMLVKGRAKTRRP